MASHHLSNWLIWPLVVSDCFHFASTTSWLWIFGASSLALFGNVEFICYQTKIPPEFHLPMGAKFWLAQQFYTWRLSAQNLDLTYLRCSQNAGAIYASVYLRESKRVFCDPWDPWYFPWWISLEGVLFCSVRHQHPDNSAFRELGQHQRAL